MNHHEFIHRNIKTILQKEGYSILVASEAADRGVKEFNRLHGTRFKKRNIFDDCLDMARNYAKLKKLNKAVL